MSESFKIWQCLLCGYYYDEEAGDTQEGLAPGTRWADIPADWLCPSCGASKAEFEMIEV